MPRISQYHGLRSSRVESDAREVRAGRPALIAEIAGGQASMPPPRWMLWPLTASVPMIFPEREA